MNPNIDYHVRWLPNDPISIRINAKVYKSKKKEQDVWIAAEQQNI